MVIESDVLLHRLLTPRPQGVSVLGDRGGGRNSRRFLLRFLQLFDRRVEIVLELYETFMESFDACPIERFRYGRGATDRCQLR